MVDLNSLVDQAAAHIAAVAARARTLAGGIALMAVATGGFAYVIGLLLFNGSGRWVWAGLGLLLCCIPGLAAILAFRRLRTATKTVAETGEDLRGIAGDKNVRKALTDLAGLGRDDHNSPKLVELGRDLLQLKSAVSDHKDEVVHLRQSVMAVTGFPGLMAIGTVGSMILLGAATVAVLLKLLF
jgi:hypothetical protein